MSAELTLMRLREIAHERVPWQRASWLPSGLWALEDETWYLDEAPQHARINQAARERILRDPGFDNDLRGRLGQLLVKASRGHGGKIAELRHLRSRASRKYLDKWLAAGRGADELARVLYALLREHGYSGSAIFDWTSGAIARNADDQREEIIRSDNDLRDAVVDMLGRTSRRYEVVVPVTGKPPRMNESQWMRPEVATRWIRRECDNNITLRCSGALCVDVKALDPAGAGEQAWDEAVETSGRVLLGSEGREQMRLDGRIFVAGQSVALKVPERSGGIWSRSLAIPSLRKHEMLSDRDRLSPRIAAALDMASTVGVAHPLAAIAAAWSIVEILLGSDDDAVAGFSAIVACSYLRAELTTLAYRFSQDYPNHELARPLATAADNRVKCKTLLDALPTLPPFVRAGDQLAKARIERIQKNPRGQLSEYEQAATETIDRLRRHRNRNLHGQGNRAAQGIVLRTAAPALGAGLDRIVHFAAQEGLKPEELAARARSELALVASADARSLTELLEPVFA